MFMGGLLLFAAAITWGVGIMMSPHGETVAEGTKHVRTVVASFMLKNAIGTLVLCALAGWLLFPARRPKWPRRDYAILGVIGLLVVSSLYNLIWLETSVFH
jgi:drug/metabolite transporter (DMT)-like permease